MKVRVVLVLVLGCIPIPLAAEADDGVERQRMERTSAHLQAGYSSGGAGMGGAALGGVLIRDLGRRFAVEASAAYLGRGMGASAVTVSAALLVHLRPTGEKAVPYLAAGGGLYRASSVGYRF